MVYRAVVEHLQARLDPDVVVIGRTLDRDLIGNCVPSWRDRHMSEMPLSDPATFHAYCHMRPDGSLSTAQRKRTGARWPLRSTFVRNRRELRISFSRIGYDPTHSQALVFVQYGNRGEYWLLLGPESWSIGGVSTSWSH
jgi:hypothetical protein